MTAPTSPGPELIVQGTVLVAVTANVRSGSPSRQSPVLRKLAPGTALAVAAIVVGEAVSGNAHWYRVDLNSFIWAGACTPFIPAGTTEAPIEPPAPANPANPATGATGYVPAKPNVVDLYHGDQVTDFRQARNAGVLGIIHKATTGATGIDDAYDRRRGQALEAELLWGAYHWGTAAPAIAQVDNFMKTATPDEQTLVSLDFERDVGNQMTPERAREFLTELADRLGRKPILYSGSTIKEALGSERDEFFGSHRLWLAQYGPRPKAQASWDSCWLWQFTGGEAKDPNRRTVPGIPGNARGEVDGNFYAGSASRLRDEWAA